MPTAPKNVFVLAFANAQLLDVSGPLQVFASANDRARGLGLPLPYHPRVIASPGGATLSSSGLALLAEPLPLPQEPCDTCLLYTSPSPRDS